MELVLAGFAQRPSGRSCRLSTGRIVNVWAAVAEGGGEPLVVAEQPTRTAALASNHQRHNSFRDGVLASPEAPMIST